MGSARRDYSLFVNIYFIFTNMSNTGDKEKETPVNTNGGNTASNSSGGPFLGYNLITLFHLEVLLLMFIAMSTLCHYVIVDAYSTLSMLMLITFTIITGSNPIINIMFIILLFWIKICRIMTKFPTASSPRLFFFLEKRSKDSAYIESNTVFARIRHLV